MSTSLRALIVEDSADDAELLARELRRSGYDVNYERAFDSDSLDSALSQGPWDIVFSDHSMPQFGSGAALQMVRGRDPDVPFVIVSGTMGEDVAVDAMRAGANDYLVKGRLARLPAVVDRELRQTAARAARRSLDRAFAALREVASAIGGLPEPGAVAELAVRHAREFAHADGCAVYGWDAGSQLLRALSIEGIPEGQRAYVLRSGEGAVGSAFVQHELVVVEDYTRWANAAAVSRNFVKSAMAAPLLVGDRAIGGIVVISETQRTFSEEQRQLLSLLASEVAPTLEVGRLFDESERQRVEAEALTEAARIVAAGALAHDGLASILTAAQRVVSTTAAGLFVPVKGGRMELVSAIGRFRDAQGRSFATASSIVGRALQSGAVQIRAEGEPPEETQIALGGPIALAVPIVRNEMTIGVLGLAADDRRFSARDVDLLRRFASLVAMALENMRLQAESDARARDLERLAHFDSLTALPNRALFRDTLHDELERVSARGGRLAILYVDIDHFKDLNNSVGPRLGDAVLRAMGPRLRETVGDAAVIARVTGDEFAVLASVVDDEAALRLSRAAHDAFAQPLRVDDQALQTRVSVGLVTYPRDGDEADTLMRRAEVAVQIAKSGEGWAAYSPAHDEYAPERLALMSELRRAIERDELVLHYQPIIDLSTRKIRALEALVRWQHPRRGMVPPIEFIPLAERAGLTKPLTVWVLREALRQLKHWRDGGVELAVSVNLSSRTLHDPELPELVRDLIERSDVPAALVGFEITETDVMADPEGAMRGLQALRSMGAHLAIDDFGTGYSSLAYLQRLAVDAVKIDRSFVTRINVDEHSAAIVRATAELGHALGLRVVAEGVEDARSLERLASISCDSAQGYHIARPMPAAAVAPWVAAWNGKVAA
ncbi:MAG TPA: EAL domain-containing protein [Candidatus Limnocylindria bacterium]|nr:EAL domain-containing protein [Candidatus Limnocylindria bacterium]